MKKFFSIILLAALIVLILPNSFAEDIIKVAAFTFDDGPNPQVTPELLDELAARDIHVTFFVNGANAERYSDIVLRAAAEGHQIANHTYAHKVLTTLTDSQVLYEVSRTQNFLCDLLGEANYLVRVPYGAINDRVQSLIDVPILMWSVDPTNGKVTSSDRMRDGIVATAHDGAIILMHDTSRANLTASIEAIDILIAEGYKFVTMDELFECKNILPAGGVKYYKLSGTTEASYFNDVSIENHWAYEAICFTLSGGIMENDERGFHPNSCMTRAEAIAILWKMSGASDSYDINDLNDVKEDSWYYKAVAWAVSEGISTGVPGEKFYPNNYITREQFYTMFYRYIEISGLTLPVTGDVAEYTDEAAVSLWAYPAVYRIRSYGFVSDNKTDKFAPKAGITRAEAAELVKWFFSIEISL